MKTEIRHITAGEYDAARELWDICFPEDANGYSAYYFSRRTKPEYVLAAFADGVMAGDLHAIPYPLRFADSVKPCAMVAGVATRPQFRHMGIASALIREAHRELGLAGAAAAVLKPDVDFYAQFGYLPFSWHDEYTLRGDEAAGFAGKGGLIAPDASRMLRIYDSFAKGYMGMMARDVRDMELYLEENALSGSAACDGENYALYYRGENGAEIYELAGKSPVRIAAAVARECGAASFSLPAGYDAGGLVRENTQMFSMLCPINEKKLIEGTGAGTLKDLLEGKNGTCCTLEFC